MSDLGEQTPQGFLPSAPGLDDLMEKVGMKTWDDLGKSDAGKGLSKAMLSADDETKRALARFYKSKDGPVVLNFIMDQTLRRSPYKLTPGQTMEQTVPYVIERAGQNATVIFLLKGIMDALRFLEQEKQAAKPKKK